MGLAVVLGGPLCIAGGVLAVRRTRWWGGIVPLLLLIALLVPGVIFRTLEPSAELSTDFPLDFYRAYGTDLATTVVPTQDSLFGDGIRSPVDRWDPSDFYGDGTNLTGAFIGGATLIAAAAGAVWLLRRGRSNRLVTLSLAVGGIACLVLGLGPSLKILDKAAGRGRRACRRQRQLDASVGCDRLPTVVKGVRHSAVRGHADRIPLACRASGSSWPSSPRSRSCGCSAGDAFSVLRSLRCSCSKRCRTACSMPAGQARRNHELVQAFEDDMDRAFGDGRLRASERVLFLPASNDYLIGMIAPRYKVFAYNISFDKEIARLRSGQPKPILDAISAYGAEHVEQGSGLRPVPPGSRGCHRVR